MALAQVSRLSALQGRFDDALRYAEELDQLSDTTVMLQRGVRAASSFIRAIIPFERYDAEAAIETARAMLVTSGMFEPVHRIEAYRMMITIRILQHDLDDAFRLLEELEPMLLEENGWRFGSVIEMTRANVELAAGRTDAALRWIEKYIEPSAATGDRPRPTHMQASIFGLFRCRVLLMQRRADEAIPLLEEYRRTFEEAGMVVVQVVALIHLSHALEIERRDDEAMATFSEAVRLAAPSWLIRIFVAEGEPIARLLAKYMGIPIRRSPGSIYNDSRKPAASAHRQQERWGRRHRHRTSSATHIAQLEILNSWQRATPTKRSPRSSTSRSTP